MEPGCFNCCLTGITAPPQKYYLSRMPPKKMMNVITRKKEKNCNPQDTFSAAVKNNKVSPIDIPRLGNLQSLRQKSGRQPQKKLHFRYLQPSTDRNSSPSEILIVKSGRSHQQPPVKMNRSCLYGGAKNILKRMSKGDHSRQGDLGWEVRSHSAKNDSFSIQEPFTLSHQLHQTKSLSKQLLQEFQPFRSVTLQSIQGNSIFPQNSIKIGKLLGRGKYCHVYMGQQVATNSLYTVKNIFKDQIPPAVHMSIMKNLSFNKNLNHPSIIGTYNWASDEGTITVIQQYCHTLLYNEIQQNKTLPIQQVQLYLKRIIEALIILHENNRVHGKLSPFKIGCILGQCKLKTSLTYPAKNPSNFLKDIHSLGLLGYEMSYGLLKTVNSRSLLRDQPCYYDLAEMKLRVISYLTTSVPKDKHYQDLNTFLLSLLQQNENQRITGSTTLTHPFFTTKL